MQRKGEEYITVKKTKYQQNVNYFGYYQYLLVHLTKNLDISSFNLLINADKEGYPQLFHIKHKNEYEKKLQEEFEMFLSLFKYCDIKFSIFDCLKEKYGMIAQVFYTKLIEKKNQNLEKYSEWINKNTKHEFLSRFPFSSLIQYIFLDVNQDDSILSCGLNNPNVCEIISERLKDGCIFINEEDEKIAKSKYDFEYPNYCVISYSTLKIPFIQEFDKVLCIVPSTNDDDNNDDNDIGDVSTFSLNKAVKNHLKQKEYLISALEKVKVGGICIYSTNSIDPFENEAVVNSVLRMNEYRDKFEIIDCSTMFKEIERNEGLQTWEVNKDFFDSDDDKIIESLSSKNIVKNMKYCMRFYPHQIHSNFTFIAVIKKIDQIERIYTHDISQSKKYKNQHEETTEDINQIQFSKADKSMIQNIKNNFGFDDEIDKIPFVFFKYHDKKLIIHINQKLMNILNQNFFESLKIIYLGSLAFVINDNYPQSQFIPNVQSLPEILKKPNKQYVIINFIDFERMIETNFIPIEQISNKNENNFGSNVKGGIFIIIKESGISIGGIINDFCIECFGNKKSIKNNFTIIKEYHKQKYEITEDTQELSKFSVSKKLFDIGLCYEEGKGVKQDHSKAIEYYQKAANLNNSDALNRLGVCFEEGEGVEQDYSKAVEYYQKAADLNNSDALNHLGYCYKKGEGVKQDYSKAFEYYQKSANLNNSDALNRLGVCYEEGEGVEQDCSKAVEYYQKAADLNNSDALYNLGLCYEDGDVVEQNYSKAIELYQRSADLNNSHALYNLGYCFEEGTGVEQDYSKAIQYYQRAADLNDSDALNRLGLCYQKGKGVKKNYSKAIEYYQRAADLGNSDALYNLNHCKKK